MTAEQLKDNLQRNYPEKITMLTIKQIDVLEPRLLVNTDNVPDGYFNCFLVLEGSIAIFCCEKFYQIWSRTLFIQDSW